MARVAEPDNSLVWYPEEEAQRHVLMERKRIHETLRWALEWLLKYDEHGPTWESLAARAGRMKLATAMAGCILYQVGGIRAHSPTVWTTEFMLADGARVKWFIEADWQFDYTYARLPLPPIMRDNGDR